MKEEIKPLKIFVGWDSREDEAYEVCRESILNTTNKPVDIIPIKQDRLRKNNWYWREPDTLGTTEFTFTRFLVPFLTDYEGWALFIDLDFVFKEDVANLFAQANDKYAVMCAHHDYTPKEAEKMDGQAQLPYPRKNWSSMVLWNCGHPSHKKLTLDLINNPDTTGAYLHRFSWLHDKQIGQISHEWNWLVGWYEEPKDGTPKALHYTEGGPWFRGTEYENCEYANDWLKVNRDVLEHKIARLDRKEAKRLLERVNVDNLTLNDRAKELLDLTLKELSDPNERVYKTKNKIQQIKEDAMGIKVAAINMPEFGILSEKSKGLAYDPFCEDFILGSGGILSDFDRESKSDNALVIRGLGGGGQKAIKHCLENGRDFYAIDTGYIQPSTRKDYHRVTKNNLQNLGPIKERPDDRLRRLNWKPTKRRKGSTILVCPPSAKVMKFYGQNVDEWTTHVLKELKNHTDRPIDLRLKPSRRERVSTNSIWEALKDAHCLVTFNSIAATEALLVGKPAISLAPNAAQVLCNKSLSEVEALNYPTLDEIHAFASHLSYCQFTPNELRSGYAWDILNESD